MGKKLDLMKQSLSLISNFCKKQILLDEIVDIPKDVKKSGMKVSIMCLGMTIIALIFAYLLKITNMLIQHKLILMGIIVFMVYQAQKLIRESYNSFVNMQDEKYEEIFNNEIILRASMIVGKVCGRVLKFDTSNKLYKVMTNEEIMNCVKNYLSQYWHQRIQRIFEIAEIISIIVMLIVAIMTNTAISTKVFVPLIFTFGIISFFSTAYISVYREEYYRRSRGLYNEQDLLINDLLRVPLVVQEDFDMRIKIFKENLMSTHDNLKSFHRRMNFSRVIVAIIEVMCQYGIIVGYLLGVEWNTISLATITEMTATLIIVETALHYIRSISDKLNDYNERQIIMKREKEDIFLILEVYNKVVKSTERNIVDDKIKISPFKIKYLENSENDKPFELMSSEELILKKGEVIILSGVSGSGKSTFMKMLTGKIRIEKTIEVPTTSKFLWYDEKLRFGSLTIFQELFCCDLNPDLKKMQTILENLNLWTEIQANCVNVWQWLKENKYGSSLSNGQNQRLVLAKLLYWLDNEDVVILDECTSGLDDKTDVHDAADAEKILQYIVNYCNQDKKRIVVIATHQNIDFKSLLLDYKIRELNFKKAGEKNVIEEK